MIPKMLFYTFLMAGAGIILCLGAFIAWFSPAEDYQPAKDLQIGLGDRPAKPIIETSMSARLSEQSIGIVQFYRM